VSKKSDVFDFRNAKGRIGIWCKGMECSFGIQVDMFILERKNKGILYNLAKILTEIWRVQKSSIPLQLNFKRKSKLWI
ncbi:MAG: hypothetical protein MSH57_00255, partial [Prevotella sp.]|nr:hypothetical protein [Prevotella sp.]